MSECRALTNVIGNGVASLVVARWEGTLDRAQLAAELGSNSGRRALSKKGGADRPVTAS